MAPKRRLSRKSAASGSTRGTLLDALEDNLDAGASASATPVVVEDSEEEAEEIEEVEDLSTDRRPPARRPTKQPRCDAAVDFLTASADFLKKDSGCVLHTKVVCRCISRTLEPSSDVLQRLRLKLVILCSACLQLLLTCFESRPGCKCKLGCCPFQARFGKEQLLRVPGA